MSSGDQRFPPVCVVPVTGTRGEGLLYPPRAPGKSGLAKKSFALIDHLRSVDKRRVWSVFGELAREEIGVGLSERLNSAVPPPVQ